jgi:hypothetical protein
MKLVKVVFGKNFLLYNSKNGGKMLMALKKGVCMSRHKKHRIRDRRDFMSHETAVAVAPQVLPPPTPLLESRMQNAPATSTLGHTLMDRLRQMNGVFTPQTQVQIPSAVRDGTGAPLKAAITGAPMPTPLVIAPPPGKTLNDLHPQIMATALNNQQYYLDLERKTGKPWIHHPKHSVQYSEFVLVNAAMAVTALKHNPNVRKIQPGSVEVYSRDMANGNWLPTSESSDIDVAGNMADGQNRMAAIEKANKQAEKDGRPAIQVPLWLTWNVAVESKLVRDTGKRRTATDKLRIILPGISINQHFAAVCRAMMRGMGSCTRYSETELAEFAMQYDGAIQWAIRNMPKMRTDVQAAVGKAYLWYGQEAIEPFCCHFVDMMWGASGNAKAANLTLYKWLMKASGDTAGLVIYKKSVASIKAFVENREYDKVYEAASDIFNWEADWKVPAH